MKRGASFNAGGPRTPSARGLRCTVIAMLATALLIPASAAAQGDQPPTPQCADGQDNDEDGYTDSEDPECSLDPNGYPTDDDEEMPGYQAPSGGGGGTTPPGGGTCTTESGPATLSNVFAKAPGDSWEPALDKLGCLFEYSEQPGAGGAGSLPQVLVSFTDKSGNQDQDISEAYPKGTKFSFDVTSSGPAPEMFVGSFADPVAQIGAAAALAASSQTITVQGKSTEVKFAFESGPQGPNCAGQTQTMSSFAGGVVTFDTGSPETAAFKGAYVGTNAQSAYFSGAQANGSVAFGIEGCGDSDPQTEEGFFQAFLPIDGTAQGGLNGALANPLADLGGQSVDQLNLMSLDDNGDPQPGADFAFCSAGQVALEPTPGAASQAMASDAADQVAGICIDYQTSFSPHDLTAKVNRKAVKAAREVTRGCKRKHGRLRIVKKNGKRTLVCKKKKKR